MSKSDAKFFKQVLKIKENENVLRTARINNEIDNNVFCKCMLNLAYDSAKLDMPNDVIRMIESINVEYINDKLKLDIDKDKAFLNKIYDLALFLVDSGMVVLRKEQFYLTKSPIEA